MIKMLVNIKLLIMIAGLTLLCFVLLGEKTNAAPIPASNTFPTPALSDQGLYMTVGKGAFESSVTGVAVTVTNTGIYRATINEGRFCNSDTPYTYAALDLPLSTNSTNGGFNTEFYIVAAENGKLEPSPFAVRGSATANFLNSCANRSVSFTFEVFASDLRPELQNQYLVFFAALIGADNPSWVPATQENSFSITVTKESGPGTAKVLPISNMMNLSNRNRDPEASKSSKIFLDFALACGSGGITTVPEFYDLDIIDSIVQPNNMTIKIDKYNRRTNALVSTIVTERNLVGGDGEWGKIPNIPNGIITVEDDFWYRATVTGLYFRNAFTYRLGVEYSVLSNIHAYDSCNRPPTVAVNTGSPNCTTFSGTYRDPDGDNVSVYLLVNGSRVVDGAGNNVAEFNLTGRPSSATADTAYSFDLSSWRDFNERNFRVVVDDGNGGIAETSNLSVGPCVRMNCEGVTIPGTLEVNRPFSVRALFRTKRNYGTPVDRNENLAIGNRGSATTYSVNVTITPSAGGPLNPAVPSTALNTSNSGNNISHTIPGYVAPVAARDLTVAVSLFSPNTNVNVNCANSVLNVGQIPYVQSFRGDIIAGYGIRDTTNPCAINSSLVRSSVDTALAPNNTEIVGSGTQTAVFARGAVVGFRSAITDVASGLNAAPWVRIFANTTGVGNPRTATAAISTDAYGGGFNSSLCAENWFNEIDLVTMTNAATVDLAGERGVRGYTNGASAVRFTTSGEILGSRKIYVEGDAIIGDSAGAVNQAVRYSNSWNSVVDIPSSIIIATGNIYIDENVTNLDGVYVAGGTVFTCSPTGGALPTEFGGGIDDQLTTHPLENNKCHTVPLTLNGAIVADSVRLWRTGGTLSKAIVGGAVIDARGIQTFTPGLTGSETFILPPEVYLAPRFGEVPTNGSTGQKRLDSLISLPPPF